MPVGVELGGFQNKAPGRLRSSVWLFASGLVISAAGPRVIIGRLRRSILTHGRKVWVGATRPLLGGGTYGGLGWKLGLKATRPRLRANRYSRSSTDWRGRSWLPRMGESIMQPACSRLLVNRRRVHVAFGRGYAP